MPNFRWKLKKYRFSDPYQISQTPFLSLPICPLCPQLKGAFSWIPFSSCHIFALHLLLLQPPCHTPLSEPLDQRPGLSSCSVAWKDPFIMSPILVPSHLLIVPSQLCLLLFLSCAIYPLPFLILNSVPLYAYVKIYPFRTLSLIYSTQFHLSFLYTQSATVSQPFADHNTQ